MGPIEQLKTGEGVLGGLVGIAAGLGAVAFAMASSGSSNSSVGWSSSGGDRAGYIFQAPGEGPNGAGTVTCVQACKKKESDGFCIANCNNGDCGDATTACSDAADVNDVCICGSRKTNKKLL
jgi:hypothetical protein